MMKVSVAVCLALMGTLNTLVAEETKTDVIATVDFGYQLPAKLVMPDGEVYMHPKIVEVRPNGITIMHDDGAAFWRFALLPKSLRDQFHYNAKAAHQYTDELLLRRIKLDEQRQLNQITDANEKVYNELTSQRYHCTYLRMRLEALDRRIAADKQNAAQDGASVSADRKTIVQESASINRTPTGWGDSNTGDAEKSAVIGEFLENWQNNKTDYEMWNFATDEAKKNRAVYQQEYDDSQAKLKQLESQWAAIQKANNIDEAKLKRQIHNSVEKEVHDCLIELAKLRQMRTQNLITTDEYIRKKAQILKRF